MAEMKNDGGPAFPAVEGPPSEYHLGMTLRDWFASKAMPDLLRYEGDRLPFCAVAKMAYEMADAMLAARSTSSPLKGE